MIGRILIVSGAMLTACAAATVPPQGTTDSGGAGGGTSAGGGGGETTAGGAGSGGRPGIGGGGETTAGGAGSGGGPGAGGGGAVGSGGAGGSGAVGSGGAGGGGGEVGSGGGVGPCGPAMPCSGGACGLPAVPADYDAVHGPGGLALGDLDGDGLQDVVVANDESGNSGSVSVYMGSCGLLSPEVRYGFGGVNSRAVATGDVDGNGHLDVVTADGTGLPEIPCSVSVYLGNGDGSLQSPLVFENGGLQTSSLALADLNGDGELDVATANEVSGDVSVLIGAGDGTFGPYQLVPSGAPNDFGTGIVARDIDGDGHADLALTNRFEDSVSLLFGHGDGTFEPFQKLHVGGQSGPIGLAIADVDGNGHLDIVASDQWNGNVRFFGGLGNRVFAPAVTSSAGPDLHLVGIVLADFTLDGKLDAAVLDGLVTNDVRLLAGNGDGTFVLAGTFPIGEFPQQNAIVTGDMNADGRPDLVVTARNSFLVQVFLSGN